MANQFNEGEMQDARDDTCCICLDEFGQGRASTVTNCNHQYHLQCILEWRQRSSNCPKCRQQVSLKEPESQELLEAVEHEKKTKAEALRAAAAQITPADLDSPSRRLTEAEIQERLRQYMVNMGRRYQFSTAGANGAAFNASRNSDAESSDGEQEFAGMSDFQAFSDSILRYRDSILRKTRSWKERLLSHGNSVA